WTIAEDQLDPPPGRDVAASQRLKIQDKASRVLPRAEDFHAAPPQRLHAAEHRDTPVRARCRQRRLHAPAMPDLTEVRVGLYVCFVLVVHLVARWLRRHLSFLPPQGEPCRR